MRQRSRRDQYLLGYFFILPTLILIGLVVFYPLSRAVYLSLTDSSFIKPQIEFVGLKHFHKMLYDPTFWLVVRNSVIWTVAVVFFQFLVGLGTALLLNEKFWGRALVRGIVIICWVTPGIITGLLWRLMYNPQLGIINGILADLGLTNPTIPWLGQVGTAMPAVILSAIWKGSPFSTIMYLAALQGVSEDMIDASKIDGTNSWQRLWYVIIPEIMPVIRVTILLTTVWTFNYFELIYIMTNGGPGDNTHIFPTFIYKLAFTQVRTGAAAAYGIVSVFILLIFSLLYIRELNRRKVLD
ncbi:MAG: carbohydrate ABC transporter permease [Anaerolineae bacterium]